MKKYIKIYHKALDIPISQDCIHERVSELGGGDGIDVHHLECRGIGGSDELDRIENLMALTRKQHTDYGDKRQYKSALFERHKEFLQGKGIECDYDWIDEQIEKWSDVREEL